MPVFNYGLSPLLFFFKQLRELVLSTWSNNLKAEIHLATVALEHLLTGLQPSLIQYNAFSPCGNGRSVCWCLEQSKESLKEW